MSKGQQNMNNKIELKTERLRMRRICENDAEAVFKYRSDAITNKYQGWIPKNINDVHDFIKRVASDVNIPGTWFQLVIIISETNEVVGDIGMHFLDNQQAEIGYTLAKSYHGKGYATEGVKKAIDFLFNELDKHRITASIDPDNHGSINLLKRLGFRKEAHFKESLLIKGTWVDDVVYAILKKEWNGVSDRVAEDKH